MIRKDNPIKNWIEKKNQNQVNEDNWEQNSNQLNVDFRCVEQIPDTVYWPKIQP